MDYLAPPQWSSQALWANGQEDSEKELMISSPTSKEGAEGDEWEEEKRSGARGGWAWKGLRNILGANC